jgi:Tol biopolymer transport system component
LRVAYTKLSNRILRQFSRASNGADVEQILTDAQRGFQGMTSWSANRRFILVDKAPADIWVIPTKPGKEPFPFINGTPHAERAAQFSPDGRWVSYESDESGRTEIYVQAFAEPGSAAPASGISLISTAGGSQSRWSADGRKLYYVDPAGRLMGVPIAVKGNEIVPGPPVSLFTTRMPEGFLARYAVMRDGRVLVLTLLDGNSSPPITIVQHWAKPRR